MRLEFESFAYLFDECEFQKAAILKMSLSAWKIEILCIAKITEIVEMSDMLWKYSFDDELKLSESVNQNKNWHYESIKYCLTLLITLFSLDEKSPK